jgi:hypothetical protein
MAMARDMQIVLRTLAAAVLWAAGGGGAAALTLELPLDCSGTTCTIQKYVDQDPGPGRIDYACGRLTNDGDTGTDIRVRDFVTLERGVPVLAAAAGTVARTRDGVDDISVREIGREALGGRDAGNSVVIDHGDGWETQYSHLKRGSVAVKPGEWVKAGQRVALMGLSGNTEFPHLNFVVRHHGKVVDPFVGLSPFRNCRDPRAPLWSAAAASALAYQPSGPLIAGFATAKPDASRARHGEYRAERLPLDAPALVFWVDLYGAMAGDQQRFRITGPDGRLVHEHEATVADSNISWFAFSGRKRPAEGWQPGRYQGRYELIRGGVAVVALDRAVQLGP